MSALWLEGTLPSCVQQTPALHHIPQQQQQHIHVGMRTGCSAHTAERSGLQTSMDCAAAASTAAASFAAASCAAANSGGAWFAAAATSGSASPAAAAAASYSAASFAAAASSAAAAVSGSASPAAAAAAATSAATSGGACRRLDYAVHRLDSLPSMAEDVETTYAPGLLHLFFGSFCGSTS